jgi:hypothetical protein
MPMSSRLLLLVCAVGAVGCATPERLTAKAIDCGTRELEIVPSVYQQRGTKTAWCAVCKDKRYHCVTNAERSRVQCRESREGDGCL